jgi:hypothetical protein
MKMGTLWTGHVLGSGLMLARVRPVRSEVTSSVTACKRHPSVRPRRLTRHVDGLLQTAAVGVVLLQPQLAPVSHGSTPRIAQVPYALVGRGTSLGHPAWR